MPLNKLAVCVSFPTAAHFKTSSWRLATALSTANSAAVAPPSPHSSWRRWKRPSRRLTTRMWWWGSGSPCAPTCQRPVCRYVSIRRTTWFNIVYKELYRVFITISLILCDMDTVVCGASCGEVPGQGCMCTDCKALWGKFLICDNGLYKINWI